MAFPLESIGGGGFLPGGGGGFGGGGFGGGGFDPFGGIGGFPDPFGPRGPFGVPPTFPRGDGSQGGGFNPNFNFGLNFGGNGDWLSRLLSPQLLANLLTLGLRGAGTQLNENQVKWLRGAAIDSLNNLRGQQNAWQNATGAYSQPLQQLLAGSAGQASPFTFGGLSQAFGGQQEAIQNLLPLFRASGTFSTPEMESAFGGLGGLAGLSGQGFAGGGWTPLGQELQDRGTDLLRGQGFQMGALGDVGADLLGRHGQTAMTDVMQGGRVGEIPQILTAAGTPILEGGRTPFTQALQQLALGRYAQPANIPLSLAVSGAANQAGVAARNRAEQAIRQAQARGGGPGSIVASGVQNQGLLDFADQGAQLSSQAVQDAINTWLGRQTQQQQLAATSGLGAGELERARLQTGGGLLSSASNAALAALAQETARMGLGGGLLSDFNQSRLGALGTLGNILGNQQRYTLGLGGLQQSSLADILQQSLGAGNLGRQRASDIGSLTNQGFGNLAPFLSTGAGLLNATYNPWASMVGDFSRNVGATIGAEPSWLHALMGRQGLGTPWGNVLSQFPSDWLGTLKDVFKPPSEPSSGQPTE